MAILKAGYSDFGSFKIKCIQKKYYKKLFLHIKGYIQFERFFNETTEYQLPGVRFRTKNI